MELALLNIQCIGHTVTLCTVEVELAILCSLPECSPANSHQHQVLWFKSLPDSSMKGIFHQAMI